MAWDTDFVGRAQPHSWKLSLGNYNGKHTWETLPTLPLAAFCGAGGGLYCPSNVLGAATVPLTPRKYSHGRRTACATP